MITTERIAELRTILNADLLDQGTAFYMACDDLPSALDTIEAQQRRIEELEAALKDASISVVAFAALEAVSAAKSHGLPAGHLLPHHYDLLEKHGARMASFTRAALQPKEPS